MRIAESVRTCLDDLTRSERQVALWFLGNGEDFAFCTLDGIAQKIDTSTTTVLRFCRRLGFDGFRDLQNAVRQQLRYSPALPEKYLRTVDVPNTLLEHTLTGALDCIHATFGGLSQETLDEAVALLCEGDRVYTFGMKESRALAHYGYTSLATVRPNVQLLEAGANGQLEMLLDLKPGDVCLAYLFHRYTLQSLQILELIAKRGVRVVLITEEPYDRVEPLAQVLIPCRVDGGGIKNTSVAPVVLTDYFCGAAAARLGDRALEHMKQAEALFRAGNLLGE